MGVLHLAHTDYGTAHAGQLVGCHVGKGLCHVAQLVGVFDAVPFVGPRREKLVVFLPLVVLGVEEVFQIVESNRVGGELLLLCGDACAPSCEEGDEQK